MKIRSLQKKKIDYRAFRLRSAVQADFSELIKEDTVFEENGQVKIIYLNLPHDTTELVAALQRIKYQESTRITGLKTRSRIFGYAPRVPMRKDFCSSTSLAQEMPKEHALVCKYAETVSEYYQKYAAAKFGEHKQTTKKQVKAQYVIEGSPFTSGIINKNNPLKYHFDAGNFVGVYSCMLGFKHNVAGGHLAIPEYDIGLEISTNSLTIFDGQKIMHGVTPIQMLADDSYRYTIVYYSLRKMWECLPINEEIDRIRNVKTQREYKRLEEVEGEAFKDVR